MAKHLKLNVMRDSAGKYCVSLGGHPAFTTRIAGAKPVGSAISIFEFYIDTQALKAVLQEFEAGEGIQS